MKANSTPLRTLNSEAIILPADLRINSFDRGGPGWFHSMLARFVSEE
jgi:hypothetical protein